MSIKESYIESIKKATVLLRQENPIVDAEATFHALNELSSAVKRASVKAHSALQQVCDHKLAYNQVVGDGRYCTKCGIQLGSDDD